MTNNYDHHKSSWSWLQIVLLCYVLNFLSISHYCPALTTHNVTCNLSWTTSKTLCAPVYNVKNVVCIIACLVFTLNILNKNASWKMLSMLKPMSLLAILSMVGVVLRSTITALQLIQQTQQLRAMIPLLTMIATPIIGTCQNGAFNMCTNQGKPLQASKFMQPIMQLWNTTCHRLRMWWNIIKRKWRKWTS